MASSHKRTFRSPLTPCICFNVNLGAGATDLAVLGNLLQGHKSALSQCTESSADILIPPQLHGPTSMLH